MYSQIILISIIVSYLSLLINIKEKEDLNIKISIAENKGFSIKLIPNFLAILFVFLFLDLSNISLIIIVSLLILMALYDMQYKLVPDTLQIILLLIAIIDIIAHYESFNWIFIKLITALITFIIFLGMAVVTNGGVGGADIKLFTIIALILPWQDTLLVVCLTYLLGTPIVLIVYSLTKNKEIALVPYIVLAFIVTLKYGENIIYWYVDGGISIW